MRRYVVGVIILSSFAFRTAAQQTDSVSTPGAWFLADPSDDHQIGVSAEKTYSLLLKGKPSRTILVAVIDTGIDFSHDDLKDVAWTNPGEIPGNDIDDDHNGYVDDIHGWNFIGSKTANVQYDTYGLTREVMRLGAKFSAVAESDIPKNQRTEYELYKKLKAKYDKLKSKNEDELETYSKVYASLRYCMDTVQRIMHLDSVTSDDLARFQPGSPVLASVKEYLVSMLEKLGEGGSLSKFCEEIREGVDYYGVIVHYGYNQEYDSRQIVGDHYADLEEKYYGNNDVRGPEPLHGTHVAGLIAADRNNNIGIKGVADHVRIMSVRAIPNGDERDKDVANAIRYAVDNGATIINMSFGKTFSPEKEVVDKAVAYAEEKGVLLIHAAGNDSDDNDVNPEFPNAKLLNGKTARNWIEVGASGPKASRGLLANFSNYGRKTVDLFAPGVNLNSTGENNQYVMESGTSMAAPVVTGVAAILMSYFPEFNASQVK